MPSSSRRAFRPAMPSSDPFTLLQWPHSSCRFSSASGPPLARGRCGPDPGGGTQSGGRIRCCFRPGGRTAGPCSSQAVSVLDPLSIPRRWIRSLSHRAMHESTSVIFARLCWVFTRCLENMPIQISVCLIVDSLLTRIFPMCVLYDVPTF